LRADEILKKGKEKKRLYRWGLSIHFQQDGKRKTTGRGRQRRGVVDK